MRTSWLSAFAGGSVEPKPSDCRYSWAWFDPEVGHHLLELVGVAGVEERVGRAVRRRAGRGCGRSPTCRRGCRSRRGCAAGPWRTPRRGTASAASFWSLSDSSPVDCTGFTMNTLAVPVLLSLAGFVACAGAPSARPVARQAAVAARTVVFFWRWVMSVLPVVGWSSAPDDVPRRYPPNGVLNRDCRYAAGFHDHHLRGRHTHVRLREPAWDPHQPDPYGQGGQPVRPGPARTASRPLRPAAGVRPAGVRRLPGTGLRRTGASASARRSSTSSCCSASPPSRCGSATASSPPSTRPPRTPTAP